MAHLRFCLLLEDTIAMSGCWHDVRGHIVEPILRSITAHNTCELALVLFGSPGFSPCVVQSSHWTRDVSQLRRWLDEVEFSGGGGGGVGLAEALAETAALLELPSALVPNPGAAGPQSHCLVCMVLDPASTAVSWPYPPAHGKWARVPGLAGSIELVHALSTGAGGRTSLGLATRLKSQQYYSTPLVLHWLHTLVPPQAPPSTTEAMFLREHQAEWRLLQKRSARTAGGSIAVLPHWEQGLHAVHQYNNAASAGATGAVQSRLAATPPGGGVMDAESPSPAVDLMTADTPGNASAVAAAGRGMTPQPAVPDASPNYQHPMPHSPMLPPNQYGQQAAAAERADPGAAAGTVGGMAGMPAGGGGGGFMDLMSMPSGVVASAAQQQQQAQQAQQQQQQQFMPPPMQQPGYQAVPRQAPPMQQPSPKQLPQGHNYAHAWRGRLVLHDRVRGSSSPLLGIAELIGRSDQIAKSPVVPLLPPDLVVTRFVALRAVTAELSKQNPLHLHMRIKEWGEEGEAFMKRMVGQGAAGVIELPPGYNGLLLAYSKQDGDAPPRFTMRMAVYPS